MTSVWCRSFSASMTYLLYTSPQSFSLYQRPLSRIHLASPFLSTNETSLLYRSPESFSLYQQDLPPQSFSLYMTSLSSAYLSVLTQPLCCANLSATVTILLRGYPSTSAFTLPTQIHIVLFSVAKTPPPPSPRADPSTNMTTHPLVLPAISLPRPPTQQFEALDTGKKCGRFPVLCLKRMNFPWWRI